MTFTFVIILSGCAATYRPINPPTLIYNSHDLQAGIGLSYKYDVLREKGNKKFAKKEDKKGVKLIAIKVTNYSDSVINIGKDFAFFAGQNQIFPMDPMATKESIKQIVPGYLLYLLLTFTRLNFTKTENGMITEQESYPIGLVLGPAITIGNMAVAGTANTNLLRELYEYNILNRDIQKGETVFGIIGVRDMGYSPISIKKVK